MAENEKTPSEEKLLIIPLGDESKKITQVISNDTARQIIGLLADAPLSASDIAERLQNPLTTITYNLENLESVGLIKVEKIKYSEKGRKIKIYGPVKKLIVIAPEKTDRNTIADLIRKYMGVILSAFLASSVIEFFTQGGSRKYIASESFANKMTSAPLTSEVSSPASNVTPVADIMNKSAEAFRGMALNTTPVPTQAEAMPAALVSTPAATPPQIAGFVNATAPPLATPSISGVEAAGKAPGFFANIQDTILAHPGLIFLLGCLFIIAVVIILDHRRNK
jgi:predicted transcriptional regulator